MCGSASRTLLPANSPTRSSKVPSAADRVLQRDPVLLAEPEVVLAEGDRGVDEAGSLVGRDEVAEQDRVAAGPVVGDVVEGGSYAVPAIASPGKWERISAPSPSTVSTRSRAITRTSSLAGSALTRTYSMSEPAATAAFEIRVQGVVVQTTSLSPSSSGDSGIASVGATAVTGSFT